MTNLYSERYINSLKNLKTAVRDAKDMFGSDWCSYSNIKPLPYDNQGLIEYIRYLREFVQILTDSL